LGAETAQSRPTTTTTVALKLEAHEPVEIRTSFQDIPPTLIIAFPPRRVTGALPERSAIQQGAIQEIRTRYAGGPERAPHRFIDAVEVLFTAAYAYHVRSEPGQIILEVSHPATVGGASLEIGLRGGTIIRPMAAARVSERFRAMQEALDGARPTAWVFRFPQEPLRPSPPSGARARTAPEQPVSPPAAPRPAPASPRSRAPSPTQAAGWFGAVATLALVLAAGAWVVARPRVRQRWALRSLAPRPRSAATDSAARLIDRLVWQSFERQGYQLVRTVELEEPSGLLRVITKDGVKSGLLCVGDGTFQEKQAVERFVAALRELDVAQGVLATPGSFTVPAQRVAKAHQVTLIGREELTELLGSGAASESAAKQLEQLAARLEESKETLRQYANELDTLRRQRNEASWYLGEERARLGKLEAQLEEAGQELRQQHAQLERWQTEGTALRRQWEESEWYLGEARARIRYLETQLGALQDAAARAEVAEHEREEAERQLAAAQQQRGELEERARRLEDDLAQAQQDARTLTEELEELRRSYVPMSVYGERRRIPRRRIAEARVELWNGDSEPLFAGPPRDVSGAGLGIDCTRQLPGHARMRVRLTLPGLELVESHVQQVWQRAEPDPPRYLSGYRLLGLPAGVRQRIDELIKHAQA
jgi:predicted  nucleic acid-binding Zn-ribbon protein